MWTNQQLKGAARQPGRHKTRENSSVRQGRKNSPDQQTLSRDLEPLRQAKMYRSLLQMVRTVRQRNAVPKTAAEGAERKPMLYEEVELGVRSLHIPRTETRKTATGTVQTVAENGTAIAAQTKKATEKGAIAMKKLLETRSGMLAAVDIKMAKEMATGVKIEKLIASRQAGLTGVPTKIERTETERRTSRVTGKTENANETGTTRTRTRTRSESDQSVRGSLIEGSERSPEQALGETSAESMIHGTINGMARRTHPTPVVPHHSEISSVDLRQRLRVAARLLQLQPASPLPSGSGRTR
jgi:hypothetical protein